MCGGNGIFGLVIFVYCGVDGECVECDDLFGFGGFGGVSGWDSLGKNVGGLG